MWIFCVVYNLRKLSQIQAIKRFKQSLEKVSTSSAVVELNLYQKFLFDVITEHIYIRFKHKIGISSESNLNPRKASAITEPHQQKMATDLLMYKGNYTFESNIASLQCNLLIEASV